MNERVATHQGMVSHLSSLIDTKAALVVELIEPTTVKVPFFKIAVQNDPL